MISARVISNLCEESGKQVKVSLTEDEISVVFYFLIDKTKHGGTKDEMSLINKLNAALNELRK